MDGTQTCTQETATGHTHPVSGRPVTLLSLYFN